MLDRRVPIVALLLLAGPPTRARADDAPTALPVHLAVRQDHLTVDLDVSAAFTKEVRHQLDSGLTNRIRITVSLHRLDDDGDLEKDPLSVAVRECEVVYDLWGERYGLVVADGEHRTRQVLADEDQVVAGCAKVTGIDLAPVGALDLRRRYRIEVHVEVNPLDPSDVERSRDYIGDPIGHRRSGDGSGGSFFGAVARLFVRDPPKAEDGDVRFESPPFGQKAIQAALEAPRHAKRAAQ